MTTALQTKQDQPEYLTNTQGHLVPIGLVPDIDKDRESLINEIFTNAIDLREQMTTFKNAAMGDVHAFVELAAEKYGAKVGGKKGNISLLNFDGTKKIQIQIAEHLHFDERLIAAKTLVDECIHKWTANSDDNIKALIEHAFQTDKQGNLNTGRVLGLMRLDITDKKWLQAMLALKDSMQIVGSTSYIRLYQRASANDKFQTVSLDMAAL